MVEPPSIYGHTVDSCLLFASETVLRWSLNISEKKRQGKLIKVKDFCILGDKLIIRRILFFCSSS